MIIEIRNDFHNTSVKLRVPAGPSTIFGWRRPYTLSAGQARRLRRELCGMDDCSCGTIVGPQDVDVVEVIDTVTRNTFRVYHLPA